MLASLRRTIIEQNLSLLLPRVNSSVDEEKDKKIRMFEKYEVKSDRIRDAIFLIIYAAAFSER